MTDLWWWVEPLFKTGIVTLVIACFAAWIGQFAGYSKEHPLWPELVEVARRVLRMHHREQRGESVARVLPREYLWFSGDGERNYFRCEYDGTGVTVCEF